MSRYEECNEDLVKVFLDTVEAEFAGLGFLNFKLVFDTKKRVKRGKIVLADIEVASPKLKFFSADEKAVEGYDYVIFVDKTCWEHASDADKKRLISRQLAHVFIDEKGRPKLINFDIEDFISEVKKNADDPEWYSNLSQLTSALYSQNEEQ